MYKSIAVVIFILNSVKSVTSTHSNSSLVSIEKENSSWEQLLSFEKTYFYDDDSVESTGKGMKGNGLGKGNGKQEGKGGKKRGKKGGKKSQSMKSQKGKKIDVTRGGKKAMSTKGGKKGVDFPSSPHLTSPSYEVSSVPLSPTVSFEPSISLLPTCTPHPSLEPTRTPQPTVTQNPSEIPTIYKAPSDFASSEPSLDDSTSVDTSPTYLTGDDRPSHSQENEPSRGIQPSSSSQPTGSNEDTRQPTLENSESPSLTEGGSARVDLAPYGLAYIVSEADVPGAIDYAEVALLTNNYLYSYFAEIFSQTKETVLSDVFTLYVSGNFFFNKPIQVDYESMAYFDRENSDVIPSQEDLQLMLKQAFEDEGLEVYLEQLSTLTSNVFSTTTEVKVVNSISEPLTEEGKEAGKSVLVKEVENEKISSKTIGVVVGSSFGVFSCVIFLFWWKRRGTDENLQLPIPSEYNKSGSVFETRQEEITYCISWAESQSVAPSFSAGSGEENRSISDDEYYNPEFYDSNNHQESKPLFVNRLTPITEKGAQSFN